MASSAFLMKCIYGILLTAAGGYGKMVAASYQLCARCDGDDNVRKRAVTNFERHRKMKSQHRST